MGDLMRKSLAASVGLLFMAIGAQAQTITLIKPLGVNTTNGSGTITSGGTFQQVFGATNNVPGGRNGCTIQNNGTHTMYVFAGPIATATDAKAAQVTAGSTYYCTLNNGTVAIQDQISIDGTTADVFYAAQQ